MSAKPGSVARWATTGAITVPPAGKQDAGWVPGETPPAETFNWLDNLAGLWQQYLNDAAFSGASTFDSTVDVTGDATVGGTLGITGLLTASGGITVPTGRALTLAGTATMTTGSGAVVLGGTVAVTGLITATAGLTAAVNQNVTVSGTGGHRHGTQMLTISGFDFRAASGTTATYDASGAGTGIAFSAGQGIIASLPMLVGRRVTAARFFIRDNASPATIVACAIDTRSSTNVQNSIGASSNSAGNGTDQMKTATVGAPTALVAGLALELFIKIQSGTGTCSLYMVEVDYDF